MDTIITFLNKILIVFFDRVRPASKDPKPKCMINTKKIDIIIHTLLIVNISIIIFFDFISLF